MNISIYFYSCFSILIPDFYFYIGGLTFLAFGVWLWFTILALGIAVTRAGATSSQAALLGTLN